MEFEDRLGTRALNVLRLLQNGSPSEKKPSYPVMAVTTFALPVIATTLIIPSGPRSQISKQAAITNAPAIPADAGRQTACSADCGQLCVVMVPRLFTGARNLYSYSGTT
jgi:hypothetical protein